MVPQFFILIDQIPKNLAGKVDKNVLSRLFHESEDMNSAPGDDTVYSSSHSWNDTELDIREIFAKLARIPVDEIRPATSIYQLGLDSISAIQVATGLRKKGYEANAADVLKYANCTELAAYLDQPSVKTVKTTKLFDFEMFDRNFRTEVLETCDIKNGDVEAIRPSLLFKRA